MPLQDAHSWQALGILTERTEHVGGPKPDSCYAVCLSSLDSDSEGEARSGPAVTEMHSGTSLEERASSGELRSLLYEGDPITLSQGDSAWVPVIVPSPLNPRVGQNLQCVFPSTDSPVEVVPGI